MHNLNDFSTFSSRLFESSVEELKGQYSIEDEEWTAMRIIPESGIPKNFLDYYKSKNAKEFLAKIVDFVSEGVFNDEPHIKDMLLNIAAVESCYGTNPFTYKKSNQTKGIFQLDKETALKTIGYLGRSPVGNAKIKKYLAECKRKIKSKLGLNWDKVPYESLSKPLYNVLAARMFIGLKARSYTYDKETNTTEEYHHPIPNKKAKQAEWWKERYNTTSGAGTTKKFIRPPGCNL